MNKVVFERSINHYSDPNQHKKELSTFFIKVTMPKKKGGGGGLIVGGWGWVGHGRAMGEKWRQR